MIFYGNLKYRNFIVTAIIDKYKRIKFLIFNEIAISNFCNKSGKLFSSL